VLSAVATQHESNAWYKKVYIIRLQLHIAPLRDAQEWMCFFTLTNFNFKSAVWLRLLKPREHIKNKEQIEHLSLTFRIWNLDLNMVIFSTFKIDELLQAWAWVTDNFIKLIKCHEIQWKIQRIFPASWLLFLPCYSVGRPALWLIGCFSLFFTDSIAFLPNTFRRLQLFSFVFLRRCSASCQWKRRGKRVIRKITRW